MDVMRHLRERFPERPPDVRQRLLQAAGISFTTYGYDGTSINSLARTVGVRPAAMYYHFDSKEELLYEFLKAQYEGFTLDIEAAVQRGCNPVSQLAHIAWTHTWIQMHFGAFSTLHMQTFSGSQLTRSLGRERAAQLKELVRKYPDRCRQIIGDGIDQGLLSVPDPVSAAYAFTTICEFTILWYRRGGRIAPTEMAEHNTMYALRLVGAEVSPQDLASLLGELRGLAPATLAAASTA